MHIILGVLGLLAAASIWLWRIRMAKDAAQELAGVASDVMAAARRFGFRRRLNLHPVESLDDPNVAFAGAAIAFLELNGLPTAEAQAGLAASLGRHLHLSAEAGQEALILGRWLMSESGGAAPGFARLTRRLFRLKGAESLEPLMTILKDVASLTGGEVSALQKDALADAAQVYRLR